MPLMKEYCRNNVTCKRDMLLKDLASSPSDQLSVCSLKIFPMYTKCTGTVDLVLLRGAAAEKGSVSKTKPQTCN